MGREHHTEYSGHDLPVKMRGPGGQSVRLQWQQHHKLSGLERAETGAEGFRYDRHGNLLAYTDGKAAILEEFLHGTQEKLGIAEKLGRYGLGSAETHVKDFMIRHKKMLGLSDEDVAILKILKDKGL